MARDGSDADYLMENGWGFIVEGDFPSDWGQEVNSTPPDFCEIDDQLFMRGQPLFETFEEAKVWAKAMPGRKIKLCEGSDYFLGSEPVIRKLNPPSEVFDDPYEYASWLSPYYEEINNSRPHIVRKHLPRPLFEPEKFVEDLRLLTTSQVHDLYTSLNYIYGEQLDVAAYWDERLSLLGDEEEQPRLEARYSRNTAQKICAETLPFIYVCNHWFELMGFDLPRSGERPTLEQVKRAFKRREYLGPY